MSATITIDKSQYRNLSCKLGKKNYVNTVIGKEYKIDTSSSVSYPEGDKNCAPSSLANYYTNWAWRYYDTAFIAPTYSRDEVSCIKGSYTFTVTGKTITNINNMKASYTLNYKQYNTTNEFITNSNYQTSERVFDGIKSESNRPEATRENDYDGSTQEMIPHEIAVSTGLAIGNGQTSGATIPSQYCTVSFVRKESVAGSVNPNYIFRVSFCFVISSGWNKVNYNFWGTRSWENTYYEVQNIQISISGYTINTDEVDMQEGSSDNQGAKILELQTNELMQSSASSSSLSFYSVATEIINAYKANRLIVTFDLINNKKYTIDGESRYLQAGDIVKIKGVDDKYLQSQNNNDSELGNDFEIIKANSKYDGFYYREIVAKEILNSNS